MSRIVDDFKNGLAVIFLALGIVGLMGAVISLVWYCPYVLWAIPVAVIPWSVGYTFRKW